MAEAGCCLLVMIFIYSLNQGNGQDAGNLGVLHVEGSKASEDFCIAYNSRTRLPSDLDKTPKYPLVEAKSPLCKNSSSPSDYMKDAAVAIHRGGCTLFTKGDKAQGHGAKEVIIISNDTLFTPDWNSSEVLTIPMAVISKNDWTKLVHKDFGVSRLVQLYAPPTANIDGNLAILWILAVGTVAFGAYWAGITNSKLLTSIPQGNAVVNENNGQESEDGSIEVTPLMVVIFVVLICGTLLLLYFFYNYLVYVVIVLFCLASCHGLYECLTPIILWLPLGSCKVPANKICKSQPQIRILILILFCMAMAIWWGIERNKSYAWVLQDILGIAFCISLIRNIRLPNLKVCTILLVLLLIYDIFFVFITPLFSAGKSVMVEVATGGGSKEQLPMVLKVPRLKKSTLSVCLRPYSLLGFGDILVPALYIGFCHSFDIMSNTPRKIYYLATTIAYGIGLLLTFVMLFVMQQGQPALLYLVPCTLITGYVIGWLRGDLKRLWTGRMGPDEPLLTSGNESEDEILSREGPRTPRDPPETQRLIKTEN